MPIGTHRTRVLFATASIFSICAASSALAQSAPPPVAAPAPAQAAPAANGGNIGEIVVTAQKREQTLQKVAVAITAFTSAERDKVGIDSVQDMTNFTPGLF